MYGADMQGTLFDPEMNTWNVAHLPNLLERVMPHGEKIPGVNTPYLYFGMWRATFAWHVEDMDLYSINYIHWGAPKYWYAIPSQRADIFEATMRKHFSAEAAECSQFMRHKSFLASPAILAEADCRPNTLVQHQGDFVITYPRGYHAGFNVGFNCAESVNFALESWIQLGRRAQYCSEKSHSPPTIQPRSSLKRKSHPADDPFPKRIRIREPDPPFATAAQLEQLPTIKIKIRPPATLANSSRPPYRAQHSPLVRICPSLWLHLYPPPRGIIARSRPRHLLVAPHHPQGPRLRISRAITCPRIFQRGCKSNPAGHECGSKGGGFEDSSGVCRGSPETWIASIEGQKYVCGVENIVKDRWTLGQSGRRIYDRSADETKQPGEGLELKEPAVTVLCPQHNPLLVEARKADKQQKLDADIGSLKQWARIKNGGSMWDQGSTKEFKYTSVVWTDDGEVQEKPGKVEGETLGSDLTGSYPSPPPTQRDTNSPNAAPSALKPSPSADQSAKSARSTPNPTSSQSTRYSFQPYQFYPYPPPYPLGPSPPPSQSYQPPQPHPGFTVPLPVPMQYPYPYPPYGTQHGYHAHPHFFAAHGYQYAPMPTYHPPASLHSVNRPHSPGLRTSAEAPRPPIQSYVGVRPASSQDILNSARQGRATTGA
ncbi:jmjN domain [Rhizoctonia solani]|uniref:JmjN domain n=1 Tax=Rhizoctonia solani TaxID=456999 RepID=A0A8H7M4M2_9AGAM|nr:jmjN domain [Rhizoctonia solani]